MTTKEMADKLIPLLREEKYEEIQRNLFAKNVVSIEPEGIPDNVTKGIDTVLEKGQNWEKMVEKVHFLEVSDPIVSKDHIAVGTKIKVSFKNNPVPMDMDEITIYEVQNGQIIKEQFFYLPSKEMVS